MEVKVPDLGSTGYFTKSDFERVLKNYIGPALNGLSLAVEELQKSIAELEKSNRTINVNVKWDSGIPGVWASSSVPEDRSAGEQH